MKEEDVRLAISHLLSLIQKSTQCEATLKYSQSVLNLSHALNVYKNMDK